MSTRDEQRERSIERISEYLLENGLAHTSLRELAAAAGSSDRMLLYYFADKADILTAAMTRIASVVANTLAEALPEGEHFTPAEMLQRASAFTTQPDMRKFMRFWIEVVAAAAKGTAPFVAISAQIMNGWQVWVESRLKVQPDTDRRAVALAIIAMIDGLALIDICAGESAADHARSALPLAVS